MRLTDKKRDALLIAIEEGRRYVIEARVKLAQVLASVEMADLQFKVAQGLGREIQADLENEP